MHTLTIAAADAVQTPSFLQTTAIVGFAVFLGGLLLMVLGVSMIGNARKGDMKKAAAQTGVSLMGIVIIALGASGTVIGLGAAVLNFFIRT